MRLQLNNISGTLGAALSNSGLTITFAAPYPAFATLSGSDYYPITLEPNTANEEIVHLTGYTAVASTGTIARGQEGTAKVAHGINVGWVHAPTQQDFFSAHITITPSSRDNDGTLLSAGGNVADVINQAIVDLGAGGGRITLAAGTYYTGCAAVKRTDQQIDWPGATANTGYTTHNAAPLRLTGAGRGKTIIRGSPGFNAVINMLAATGSTGRTIGALTGTYVGGVLQTQGIKNAEVEDIDFDMSTYSGAVNGSSSVVYGAPGATVNGVVPVAVGGGTNANYAIIWDPGATNNHGVNGGLGFDPNEYNFVSGGVAIGGVYRQSVMVNGDNLGFNNPTVLSDGKSYWGYAITSVITKSGDSAAYYLCVLVPDHTTYPNTLSPGNSQWFGTTPAAGTQYWIVPPSHMVCRGYGMSQVAFRRGTWSNCQSRFFSFGQGSSSAYTLNSPTCAVPTVVGSGTSTDYTVVAATDFSLNNSQAMTTLGNVVNVNSGATAAGNVITWPYMAGTRWYFPMRRRPGGANAWSVVGIVASASAVVPTDRPDSTITSYSFTDPGTGTVADGGGHAVTATGGAAGALSAPSASFVATDIGRKCTGTGTTATSVIIQVAANGNTATVGDVNTGATATLSGTITLGGVTPATVAEKVTSPFYTDNDHIAFEDVDLLNHATGAGTELATLQQTDWFEMRRCSFRYGSYAGLIAYYMNRNLFMERVFFEHLRKGNSTGAGHAVVWQEPITQISMKRCWANDVDGDLMGVNQQSGQDRGKGQNGVAFASQVTTEDCRYTLGGGAMFELGAVRGFSDRNSYCESAGTEGLTFNGGGGGMDVTLPCVGISLVGTQIRNSSQTSSQGGVPAAVCFETGGASTDYAAVFSGVRFSDEQATATQLSGIHFAGGSGVVHGGVSIVSSSILSYGVGKTLILDSNGAFQAGTMWLSGRTDQGSYAAGTTYAAYDLVAYQGRSYVSLAAGNTGHTPGSSPLWWLNTGVATVPVQAAQLVTASGSVVLPSTASLVEIHCVGGGGGGGGGGSASNGSATLQTGGSGGGAGGEMRGLFVVSGGPTLTVTIGAGGAVDGSHGTGGASGGAGGNAGTAGNNGGNTSVTGTGVSLLAGGGGGGSPSLANSTAAAIGGGPGNATITTIEGAGGNSGATSRTGRGLAGTGGAGGGPASATLGGGGGGGGQQTGKTASAGGSGTSGTSTGVVGVDSVALGGGGGGGGGGAGTATAGAGGNGGAGGAGFVVIQVVG